MYQRNVLHRWSDTLNGVLVAYAEERIVSTQVRLHLTACCFRLCCLSLSESCAHSQATIHPYFPYIHVHVSARVLVFAPRAGCSLSAFCYAGHHLQLLRYLCSCLAADNKVYRD